MQNPFPNGILVPWELLKEMTEVIQDLYPGHPTVQVANDTMAGHFVSFDIKGRMYLTADHKGNRLPESEILHAACGHPPINTFMDDRLNFMTRLNKVDVNLGSVPGRPVELPGTIEAVPSTPATEKEVEAELTGADKWHRCIKAKLQRSDDVLNRAIKYYDLSSRELYAKLNAPSSLPNPTFTLQGLYWVFESSPGYWEDVWENCFGCKIC
ncbi:hypothetical protein D5W64_13375 [Salmonella enterica subsp. enterica serovar Saintpaul]|nr:hypothetical protein [Salmonella enterica subsp. enterica serovar Saintpaul]